MQHGAAMMLILPQTKFALNMISIIGLGLVKSSILVMYKNIFAVRKFQIVVYAVLAYVIGWTISFSISHLFTCYPITVFIEPYYNNNCVETVPMFLALLVSNEMCLDSISSPADAVCSLRMLSLILLSSFCQSLW